MDKIIAVVLNPALDVTIWADRLDFVEPIVSQRERVYPAGRAVNEARVYHALSVDCLLLGIAGNQNVGLFNSLLTKEGVNFVFLETEGYIRENIAVVFPDGQMLKINRPGFPVSGDLIAALTRRIERELSDSRQTVAVFAGSLPPGVSAMRYRDLIVHARDNGALIALDTAVFTERQIRELHPFIIKPNLPELCKLAGRALTSIEEITAYARTLAEAVEYVLVSLGGDGLLCVQKETALLASVPEVEVCSTIGAGDTTLAGFVTALRRKFTLAEAVRFAASCGTASVRLAGTETVTAAAVEEVLPLVTVQTLD